MNRCVRLLYDAVEKSVLGELYKEIDQAAKKDMWIGIITNGVLMGLGGVGGATELGARSIFRIGDWFKLDKVKEIANVNLAATKFLEKCSWDKACVDFYNTLGLSTSGIFIDFKLADTPGTAASQTQKFLEILKGQTEDDMENRLEMIGFLPNMVLLSLYDSYTQCTPETQDSVVASWLRALNLVNQYNNQNAEYWPHHGLCDGNIPCKKYGTGTPDQINNYVRYRYECTADKIEDNLVDFVVAQLQTKDVNGDYRAHTCCKGVAKDWPCTGFHQGNCCDGLTCWVDGIIPGLMGRCG